jgi:hypothetical protein
VKNVSKIVLCCGKRRCATVETTEYGYEIKDDYGGTAKLTKDEMEKLRSMKF